MKNNKHPLPLIPSHAILLLMLSIILLSFTGCEDAGNPVRPIIPSEDSLQGNTVSDSFDRIMASDKGYYYNEFPYVLSLHYQDAVTGKDVLLCNKPECRHDGNQYCIATNANYTPIAFQYYANSIFACVCETVDDTLNYKLLQIAPDGSSLSELATYFSTPANGIDEATAPENTTGMLIHRNKAIINYSYHREDADKDALHPENMDKDAYYNGVAIIDLNDFSVTQAYEEAASPENMPWTRLTAKGDFLYYVIAEAHKNILHKRNLTDGTDEILKLATGFGGDFVVLEGDRIVYTRTVGRSMFLYDPKDESNTETAVTKDKDFTIHFTWSDKVQTYVPSYVKESKTDPYTYAIDSIVTDGERLYVLEQPNRGQFQIDKDDHHPNIEEVRFSYNLFSVVHIFNGNLEETGSTYVLYPFDVMGMDVLTFEKWLQGNKKYATNGTLRFLGDQVYLSFPKATLVCNLKTFLAGKPNFQMAYEKQWVVTEDPY